MKKIILSLFALLITVGVFSQSRVTVTEYQKIQLPAVENEISYPEKTTSKAIEEKLKNDGYKGKDSKGFIVYQGIKVKELGSDVYDLYFKIERKSKKMKDISVVTAMVSKGTAVFVSEATDPVLIENLKRYLEDLAEVVKAYDLELQIAEQEDVVKKADKKLAGLVDDGQDLAKKQKKIQEQIADNTKEQASQKSEAAKQLQILETLKGKRK